MNSDSSRIVFGLLIGQLEESYFSAIWAGIAEYVEDNNIDLYIFTACSPGSAREWNYEHNIINDYITKDKIDGLIVLTNEMNYYITDLQIKEICYQYKDIPLISTGYELDGYKSIIVDNKLGVIEAVNHLVLEHNRKRILFIKGLDMNFDTKERFEAYKNQLLNLNIEFDPELVFTGNYSIRSGSDVIEEALRRNIQFDAVLSSNDSMAIGVIDRLKSMGFSVPEDISVIGYDDIEKSRVNDVPLTTIRQPLYELGWQSAELLRKLISSKHIPTISILPTAMVFRESCGCFMSNKYFEKDTDNQHNKNIKKSLNQTYRGYLTASLNDKLSSDNHGSIKVSNLIISIFDQFLIKETDLYKKNLSSLINYQIKGRKDLIYLQNSLIKVLRELSSNLYTLDQKRIYESIMSVLDRCIMNAITRVKSNKNIKQREFEWITADVSRHISDSFDFESLINNIKNNIPRLGIKTFYLTLFNNESDSLKQDSWKIPDKTKVVTVVENYKLSDNIYSEDYYDSINILPVDIIRNNRGIRKTLIILPLFFNKEQYGLMIFSYKASKLLIYENLRTQISGAVKVSRLITEKEKAEEELKKAFIKIENSNFHLKDISLHDELTGLYNRRGFFELGKKEFHIQKELGGSFILFFMDLDGLKQINDTYGHDAGDLAIKEFGNILVKVFRENDIIARLAGDEFTIIALDAEKESVKKLLVRMDNIINEFNIKSNTPFKLSASSGYSIYNGEMNTSFENLIEMADKKLYIRKRDKKAYPIVE